HLLDEDFGGTVADATADVSRKRAGFRRNALEQAPRVGQRLFELALTPHAQGIRPVAKGRPDIAVRGPEHGQFGCDRAVNQSSTSGERALHNAAVIGGDDFVRIPEPGEPNNAGNCDPHRYATRTTFQGEKLLLMPSSAGPSSGKCLSSTDFIELLRIQSIPSSV